MGATSVNQSDLKNNRVLAADLLTTDQIDSAVEQTLASTLFVDIHTHLFSPTFGKLGLWGIDELLTYHYLEAEFFRSSKTTPEQYWKLSKRERADAIWRALFVENSPISESTRGIIAVLQALDLPTGASALEDAREFFSGQSIEQHIGKVFEIAGVSDVVMTNDPLDPEEQRVWLNGDQDHAQFHAVLRLDRILWVAKALAAIGEPGLRRRREGIGKVDRGGSPVSRCLAQAHAAVVYGGFANGCVLLSGRQHHEQNTG